MDRKKQHNFFRFLAYVKPYRGAVLLAALGGVVKFTLPLLVPQLTRHLIDNVFVNQALAASEKVEELFFYAGIMIGLFVIVWAPFTYMRSYFAGKAGHRSVFDLRCDLYYHILRMSSSFFSENKSGGIVSRLISDVALVQNLVGSALTNIWIDGAAVFVIIYFLLGIDPPTALVAMATFPLYIFFFKKIGSKIKKTSYDVQKEIEIMSGDVQEKMAGNVVVRSFTREKHEEKIFNDYSENLFITTMRRIMLQSVNISVSGLMMNLAPLLVIIFGGYRVVHGMISLGDLIAVTMYLHPLYLPLQRFSELNVVFSNSMAALQRIFEIMDQKPEIMDKKNAHAFESVAGHVRFENVFFGYNNGEPILKGMSFDVQAGTRVALVGKSGSGKSTVVSLIPRLYDVNKGRVAIDGYDVRDVKQRSLRRQIGMVLQDPILFSGTIRENIRYGRPKADNKEIVEACEMANALEFIKTLPNGMGTEVGEQGVFLSGGQKQRITIARAFLKNPKILILDEATSSLDSVSEAMIQEALERLMEGRTTFIIAHRLSTIVNVDNIMVLDNGSIIESGNHTDLLKKSSEYRKLYEIQFGEGPRRQD